MELTTIQKKVISLRGCRVMLDFELAALYEVETRLLKQAVRRNQDRFPPDFMFELTAEEIAGMVSQNVIPSKSFLGGATPFAFTEQGVAMLSSVLKSQKALQVNIMIMRAFVLMRQYVQDYAELKERINGLETEMNAKFSDIYQALDYLLDPPRPARKQIGFKPDD
ncbi:ORF6N domain-containing protein [Dyadobacter sandarakinus]|uniref:ORF6N domain-containing protein n=1 Tax=Dyadobacter sandarakinus TaxID=2747268 RepID=A0ABX7I807_9BACT|nr:ORF6N domain-containing protein [Dyadobacter sandarakinus]QRR01930.1 ORF6N domain-containing protein [Dyadobacter sandarakinus]